MASWQLKVENLTYKLYKKRCYTVLDLGFEASRYANNRVLTLPVVESYGTKPSITPPGARPYITTPSPPRGACFIPPRGLYIYNFKPIYFFPPLAQHPPLLRGGAAS